MRGDSPKTNEEVRREERFLHPDWHGNSDWLGPHRPTTAKSCGPQVENDGWTVTANLPPYVITEPEHFAETAHTHSRHSTIVGDECMRAYSSLDEEAKVVFSGPNPNPDPDPNSCLLYTSPSPRD